MSDSKLEPMTVREFGEVLKEIEDSGLAQALREKTREISPEAAIQQLRDYTLAHPEHSILILDLARQEIVPILPNAEIVPHGENPEALALRDIYQALHPATQSLFQFLVRHTLANSVPPTVSELQAGLGVSRNTVSWHLKKLVAVGLVTHRENASRGMQVKGITVSLDPLLAWAIDYEPGGQDG